MTSPEPEDDDSGERTSRPRPAHRPRGRGVVAVAGLAVVLGAGAYVATTELTDEAATTERIEAVAPLPDSSLVPSPSREATTGGQALKAEPTATERSKEEVDREIADARASAAAEGHPLARALQARPDAIQGEIDERVEQIEGGNVRITAARFDLTGHPQMLVAGGKGTDEGNGVKCTDEVRFAEGQPAVKRPTILVCWRLSGKRSVITFTATPKSKPSSAESVALIDREWRKLN